MFNRPPAHEIPDSPVGVKLALDGAISFIATELGDEIDASVILLNAPRRSPFAIGGRILILLDHLWIMLDELDAEAFEVGALLALGLCPLTITRE